MLNYEPRHKDVLVESRYNSAHPYSTGLSLVVRFTPWPLHPWERAPGTRWI